MTAGLIGSVIAPDTVFRWSLYLLLALWPVTVFSSGRLFGLNRWTAAAAAAVSPFLASVPGIGYESKAYVWAGFGVWTQLWASWTLPLAWGFTYRAPVVAPTPKPHSRCPLHHGDDRPPLRDGLPGRSSPSSSGPSSSRRTSGGGSDVPLSSAARRFLASAWVVVPVLAQSHWAAKNQVLEGTGLENGYGARQILDWLVTGRMYDDGRIPVVTILLAVGIAVSIARWRRSIAGRALVTIWFVTLLMTFGRTTFGGLYAILPGSSDVFIRRFQMGVQLSGILLAGVGAAFLGRWLLDAIVRRLPEERRARLSQPAGRRPHQRCLRRRARDRARPGVDLLGLLRRAQRDQRRDCRPPPTREQEPQIDQLIRYVRAHPRGRVYAGLPTNWGSYFTVGAVPVFKYLENEDIDEVGYTLRTASLMTDPEYHFDEANPGDYPLFGIGYVIVPAGREPPVPAHRVGCSGPYCLWALPDGGFDPPLRHDGRADGRTGPTSAPRALPCSSPRCSKSIATWPSPSTAAGRPRPPPREATASWSDHRAMCWSSTPTWRTAKAQRPGACGPRHHGRLERLLRPRVARHRRRARPTHGHGRASTGRRRRRSRHPYRHLQLRRVRLLQRAVRARARSCSRSWPPHRRSPASSVGTAADGGDDRPPTRRAGPAYCR